MCLAVPGEILEIDETGALRMGRVSFDGAVKHICLAYTPNAAPGDHVLVHAGFALSQIDRRRAQSLLDDLSSVLEGGQT